jgi:hypothetical protein
VQFRAEFFNIFNQVNFDLPKVAVNNTSTLAGSPPRIRTPVIRALFSSV